MSDMQFNFLLSIGGPAEPLDTTGRTLRFREHPVEKHCHRSNRDGNGRFKKFHYFALANYTVLVSMRTT